MTNIAYKYFSVFPLKITITQKPIHCPQYQPFYLPLNYWLQQE